MEQVARKAIYIATKVKIPKTFELKYKTTNGKILDTNVRETTQITKE